MESLNFEIYLCVSFADSVVTGVLTVFGEGWTLAEKEGEGKRRRSPVRNRLGTSPIEETCIRPGSPGRVPSTPIRTRTCLRGEGPKQSSDRSGDQNTEVVYKDEFLGTVEIPDKKGKNGEKETGSSGLTLNLK